MFINDVIAKFYPIQEATDYDNDSAVKKLGTELDRIYNKGGSWKIEGVDPTMGEVAELYDIYKNIVHDHIDLDKIETISKNVSEILKRLGFNVVSSGSGWKLSESVVTEGRRYTIDDVPAWAKQYVIDEFGERQTYHDLYVGPDFIEVAYSEGGDDRRYRIRKNGMVTQR